MNIHEPLIQLDGVTFHYGLRPLLRDVSLSVGRGELVVLMGPNGMGKSTILSIMAGAITPLKGRVIVDGLVRRSTPENELAVRQRVAYLPDHPWVPLTMTGREYVVGVGRLYGVDDDTLFGHAERLFDLFQLTEKADSVIGAYSTGQKKKICLAAVLATDAPILLLDEPFSGGLDPEALFSMRRVLQYLAERKDRTVVMTTPVPELVEGLAHRIALIDKGAIAVYGTPAELMAQTGAATLEEVFTKGWGHDSGSRIDRYFDGGGAA